MCAGRWTPLLASSRTTCSSRLLSTSLMKRLLIPFLALALCPPAQATAYWLNIKGWNQPDWWQCDDRPGLVRLPHYSPGHMNESWCVRPSTFIKTSAGGRVEYQQRDIWTKDAKLSPSLATIIKHPSKKGDKSGRMGWMEVNCQAMESRQNQFFLAAQTSPNMHRSWKELSWQPGVSVVSPNEGWWEWRPMLTIGPVEKWICEQD